MKEEHTVVLGDLERRFGLLETGAGEHEPFHTAESAALDYVVEVGLVDLGSEGYQLYAAERFL